MTVHSYQGQLRLNGWPVTNTKIQDLHREVDNYSDVQEIPVVVTTATQQYITIFTLHHIQSHLLNNFMTRFNAILVSYPPDGLQVWKQRF
jgi:hypothetical protein